MLKRTINMVFSMLNNGRAEVKVKSKKEGIGKSFQFIVAFWRHIPFAFYRSPFTLSWQNIYFGRIPLAVITTSLCLIFNASAHAFEEIVTVPAESESGVVIELEAGEYMCEYAGGAITLFFPINPNYCWRVGAAVGIEAEGGQDVPDIGTIYFDPNPKAESQYAAEIQAMNAVQQGVIGTMFDFSLQEKTKVRFWVSDYDYSDNSGMIKLRLTSNTEG